MIKFSKSSFGFPYFIPLSAKYTMIRIPYFVVIYVPFLQPRERYVCIIRIIVIINITSPWAVRGVRITTKYGSPLTSYGNICKHMKNMLSKPTTAMMMFRMNL